MECDLVVQRKEKVSIEIVTPDLALEWITGPSNRQNRPVSKGWVNKLVTDILEGRWELNGETIKFDTEGDLIDGQHRLYAIVEANVPLPMTVVRGLPREVRHTIDIGRKRSLGSIIHMQGVANGNGIVALSRAVIRYQGDLSLTWSGHNSPTDGQILEMVEAKHDQLQAAYSYGTEIQNAVSGSATAHGVLAYMAVNHTKHRSQFESFHDALKSGEMLATGNPALVLRNWYIDPRRERMARDAGQQKYVNVEVRAFNAFMRPGKIITRKALHLNDPVTPMVKIKPDAR